MMPFAPPSHGQSPRLRLERSQRLGVICGQRARHMPQQLDRCIADPARLRAVRLCALGSVCLVVRLLQAGLEDITQLRGASHDLVRQAGLMRTMTVIVTWPRSRDLPDARRSCRSSWGTCLG